MRIHVLLCLLLLFLPFLQQAQAADTGQKEYGLVLSDQNLGYMLPLPVGWKEIQDPRELQKAISRVCAFFVQDDGHIPGASHVRAARLPGDSPAAPAMVIFAVDYPSLGLSPEAIEALLRVPENTVADLANALQFVYLEKFPQSIMINNQQGSDFFYLNLRSVLDFSREQETTRNQRLKVILASQGALVLTSLYEGAPDLAYDDVMASSVREFIILPEKSLASLKPPFAMDFLDYIILIALVLLILVLVKKMRR